MATGPDANRTCQPDLPTGPDGRPPDGRPQPAAACVVARVRRAGRRGGTSGSEAARAATHRDRTSRGRPATGPGGAAQQNRTTPRAGVAPEPDLTESDPGPTAVRLHLRT